MERRWIADLILPRGLRAALLLTGLLAASARPGLCEWQTFTQADGLGASGVSAIAEDAERNLWFANWGVTRYDGASWKTFRTEDGLVGDDVEDVLVDRSGNLWVATDEGVSVRREGVWTSYTTENVLPSNNVRDLHEDPEGNLWFATSDGVARFDGESWRTFTTDDGLPWNGVSAIWVDQAQRWWFGTGNGGGVSRFDGSQWRTFTEADGLADGHIRTVWEDRSGRIWVGSARGLHVYDETDESFRVIEGIGDTNAVWEDLRGSIWCAAYGGAHRYDGREWRQFGLGDGPVSEDLRAGFTDSSGNVWLGSPYGLNRFDGSDWRILPEMPSGTVSAIHEDAEGVLWFGYRGSRGVARFDGEEWFLHYESNGFYGRGVTAILRDERGDLWVGTEGALFRYDGVEWEFLLEADSASLVGIRKIVEDQAGNLWFAGQEGAFRYHGAEWHRFGAADGLASDFTLTVHEDSEGTLWFGTLEGLTRYDGERWETFTFDDGLPDNRVTEVLEDHTGLLWVGTSDAGVGTYDGSTWTRLWGDDRPASGEIAEILEDDSGNVWVAGDGGVSRYDRRRWRDFTAADGLADERVLSAYQDRAGLFWFGTRGAATVHEPDRVPPRSVISPQPPPVSGSRQLIVTYQAAFGETRGIEFAWGLDRPPDLDRFSATGFSSLSGLADGVHTFEVVARDWLGNVDPVPARCVFEIDATPPTPVLSAPAYGQALRGSVAIRGDAWDPRFVEFRLTASFLEAPGDAALLRESQVPVTDGVLAEWDTTPLPDGAYELLLTVDDSLELRGTAVTTVIVDNHEPWAEQTSPALVSAADGGHVFTTDGAIHLYFPPRAFVRDAVVTAAPSTDAAPDSLGEGIYRVQDGFELGWEERLEKTATLELVHSEEERTGKLALYVSEDGLRGEPGWRRIGGTSSPSEMTISAPVTVAGRYALYEERVAVSAGGGISRLSLTPRVFSPRGGFGTDQLGISFTLGRPGLVSVKIYNRAGRLVREVAQREMNSGEHLLRWDGRDRQGHTARDGIYLVTIEALGSTQVETVAIVR